MISELLLLIAIFALCVFLAYEDLRSAFIFLLLVSPLLHKEVFSLVKWDVLPIRIVILAILATSVFKFILWFKKTRDFLKVKKFLLDPMLLVLLALFLIRVISLFNSRNLVSSLLVLTFYATMVFLYILLSYLSERYGVKFVLSLIKFYSLVAFGTAVIASLQFVLDIKYGIIFGALWRIPGKLSRVGSVFWDVNHYGGFISAMIPVVLGLLISAKSKTAKVFYSFMSVFMFLILLLTNSRSAWIGFFVSMTVFVAYILVIRFKARSLLYVLLAVFLLSIPATLGYRNPESLLRQKVDAYFHYRGDSFASHLMLLQGAYEVFEKFPVLGGGYGSFFEHFKDTKVAASYYSRDPAALLVRVPAHSIWGEILSETGFLGMIVFTLFTVILLGTTFYAASESSDRSEKYLLASLGASALSFLVSGIFYSYNAEFFWIILFLSFVISKTVLGKLYDINNLFSYITSRNASFLALIFLIGSLLIFVNLSVNHLIPWDEAIYAKVSKNMVISGNYLTQSWEEGKEWLEKPPFYMWSSALFMKLLGFNSLSVKLPSAIFGFATVVVVYFMGKKMFNAHIGFLSSMILLTTSQYLYYSRVGMLDVTLTFFITISTYFFSLSLDKKDMKLGALAGFFGGLSVMTKGVVGILSLFIILLTFGFFLIRDRREITKKSLTLPCFYLFTFLLAGLPWHLHQYFQFGESFTKTYFGYHVLKRATESVEGKGEPFFWYITVLKTSMRVWFIGLLVSLLALVSSVLLRWKVVGVNLLQKFTNSNFRLVFIWSLFIFLFFSSAVSKLVWYIMPIYPFLAIFTAFGLYTLFEAFLNLLKKGDSKLLRFLFVYLISGLGLLYLFYVRGLVYVSDSTGSKARLVLLKDNLTGIGEPLYYDRIEKPLPLFYSDSEVRAVDYNPLFDRINDADFNEAIVYITSQRRYEKLSSKFSDTVLLGSDGDLVLARVKSRAEVTLEKVSYLRNEIDWIQKKSLEGDPLALSKVKDLPVLKRQLSDLEAEYEKSSKD